MDKIIFKQAEPLRSILIFGPPGSGKGTLSKFLSSAGNHYHLSSGDIFRGLSPESPAGKTFHKYAGEGKLVPDEVTIEVWKHYVWGLIATNCYFPHEQFLLLDGVPRTIQQVELIAPHVNLMHIINLEMPNVEGLVGRLKRRAMIERRMDDFDEKILRTRMQVYENETVNVLGQYPSELISSFNADQPPLDVLRDVLVKLSYLLTHSKL
ncbi:MAG: adenylate kinase [Chlamydiae bacterium]|nr:adenylate kinase [Chlamydiota bacterium]